MAYTTIDKGSSFFNTVLYTGDGTTSKAITGVGFQPDLIWTKGRNIAAGSIISDSNRGANKQLQSASGAVEETLTTTHKSFDSDGFTLGNNGNVNTDTKTYVGWNWLAGGTAPSKTYKVVVVSDSGNKYRFRNSGDTATFAESAVQLELQEGGTYTFDLSDSTVDGHPMLFSETEHGTHNSGTTYETGVVYKLDGVTKTKSQFVDTTAFNAATTRQIIITVAASAPTLYYYCNYHSGMGGQIITNTSFGSTNFDGSIKCVVTENTTSGFSIAKWTGTGSDQTIGHGLGKVPKLVIVKSRANTTYWMVFHSGIGNAKEIYINENSGMGNSTTWNTTSPTSTAISLDGGSGNGVNYSDGYIAYSWAEIQGYSKIGTYTGNANANGPFAYCGFKPAYVVFKRTGSTAADWQCWDNKRDTENPVEEALHLNLTNTPSSDQDIDILSNGFKIRSSVGHLNASGETFIFWAFAEHPFVSSTGTPVAAR